MAWIMRTMIIRAADQSPAKLVASGLAGEAADGMWTTGLSASGSEPPTHYVSTGCVEERFGEMLGDADDMYAAAQLAHVNVTLENCQNLVKNSIVADVADESPFDTFARIGLQLIQAKA